MRRYRAKDQSEPQVSEAKGAALSVLAQAPRQKLERGHVLTITPLGPSPNQVRGLPKLGVGHCWLGIKSAIAPTPEAAGEVGVPIMAEAIGGKGASQRHPPTIAGNHRFYGVMAPVLAFPRR